MKKILFSIFILLLFSLRINSQEIFQQSVIELKEALDGKQTYLYQATSSIEMLPGFSYVPTSDNNMSLDIDRYSVFPPLDDKYGGYSADNNCVVGSIPATINVSSTGAAYYSVDIQLPMALGGMTPNLSLAYNNQSSDGLLGWSWDLIGLSSIERVGQTEYHDGKTTSVDYVNDRYALDGQRLMTIGDDVYKTEIDNCDKIASYPGAMKGPDHFIVWKNDGTIWEYGVTEDSKIEPQGNNNIVFKWLLSKVTDRSGNTIRYNYLENNATGEYYIRDIEYASNDKANVSPAYKVMFQYEDKIDSKECYVYGNKISNAKILKNIEVFNNYSGKKIIEYALQYDAPGYYDNKYYIRYRLNSIHLTIDGMKVNPTRIVWDSKGENSTKDVQEFKKYELDKTKFNRSSFVGDFNGDGLSDVLMVPYKIQDVYSSDVVAEVYLNMGGGTFSTTPFVQVTLSKYLDWIYIVDINGDGIDDIIPCEIHYDDENVFEKSKYSLLVMEDGVLSNEGFFEFDKPKVVLPGNFVDKYVNGLLILDAYDGKKNNENANYIVNINGFYFCVEIKNSSVINGKNISAVALDMSGDGACDLLSLEDDGYKVYKIMSDSRDLYLDYHCGGTSMTNKIYTFPNDYNGDGKTDVLFYDPAHFWNITMSKGNAFTEAELFTDNNLLRNVRLNSKDKYCYSLKEMQKPTVTIRTADFDGDGSADIGVFHNSGGNYYLDIGFALHRPKGRKCYELSYQRRYYMPLNYSHQTIQIGRFLPQENVSILSGLPRNPSPYSKAYITSLIPNSEYYSVEQIIDGMGNATELSYDYLFSSTTHKQAFYVCERTKCYDVDAMSLPVLALKELRTYNVNDKAMVKKYNYKNALVHKKGHGFMGFETVIVRDYIDNNIIQKHHQEYTLEQMNVHCMPVLSYDALYHGENQLVNKRTYTYDKYVNNRNDKVMMPLMVLETEEAYDLDKEGVVMKNVMTANVYLSDVLSGKLYNDIVQLTKTTKGYDNVKTVNVNNSQYIEEKQFVYDNDLTKWLINRPNKITEIVRDRNGSVVGNVRLLEYDVNVPTQIARETMIPNVYADMRDSLMSVVSYRYDNVGNMVEQRLSSPSLRSDKITKSVYGEKYQYRYKTKSIDEMGREIMCEYDDDFGMLRLTKDFNGFTTAVEKEPFGVENVVVMPDGMKNVKVVRWSENNRYAPQNAAYYIWEKSVGKAETMCFFHKSGAELRQVTFDLDGVPVFVDKIYDDFGNIIKESYPYYENEDKYYVSNVYDAYNRKIETISPDDVKVAYRYDGNVVETEYSAANNLRRFRKDTYNVMGWLLSTIDNGGAEIKYGYYSDGMLKMTQIGGNGNTKIDITYDSRRNKTSICDPSYGLVKYKNDALGNVLEIANTHDVVKYEYDVLGRVVSKIENNNVHNTKNIVRWEYGKTKGQEGLLTKITSSNNHQIEYIYDDKLRVVNMIESINGTKYETSYSYDEASRVSSMTYPSGYRILKKYSNSGYERMICDAKTKSVLWKTNKTNPNGFITEYQLGNGSKSQYSYNPKNFMIENIMTTNGDEVLQHLVYIYDEMCNLISRSDMKNYNCEEFEYDVYDRLTRIMLNGKITGEMKYYKNGNISEKVIDGAKVMYNTVYAANKPNTIMQVQSDDKKMYERLDQNIKYSTFDNVIAIDEYDKSLLMKYGYDNERIYMKYIVGGDVKEKTYVGSCEFVVENGKEKTLTYIEGPMGVFAVHVNDGEEAIDYVYKDNLDSWNIIADQNGKVIEELSFDAWGNMRNPIHWDEDVEDETMLYDRGFTGHEHLLPFGLINMNGRLYDPVMSMMLSPDNNIQMPKSSQNFNRYSYCLNNPLKYTDPTGEWVESVAFGVVGGAVNLLFNARDIDSFGEAAVLFGVGFVKGFLAEYTLGRSWFLQVGVGAMTEGLVSGANYMVSIGDGSFNLSGDDWNSVKSASYYGLGSGLVKSFMYKYMTEPTDTQYGESIFESSNYREIAHGMTSLVAHGMGCWFSGQEFLPNMKLADVGFDLKMFGIIANRLISSYIRNKTDFGEKNIEQRAKEIKNMLLQDMLSENPDTPDFDYEYSLMGVFIEDFRLYIVGNIYEILPSEYDIYIPKPYFEEIVTFPFSFSLFKTLFFDNE